MTVGFITGTPQKMQPSALSVSGFGDSITHGLVASTTPQRWINIVNSTLNSGTLNNSGIDGTVFQDTGNQASNGYSRYATDILASNKTEMVFILYGYNDARFTGSPATTTTAYTTEFQTMITALLAGGYTNRTIVLGSPPFMNATGYTLGGPTFSGSNDSVMQAYRDCVFGLAQANGLFYANIYQLIKDNQSYISGDNIHPNDAGHAAIAAAFLAATKV